MTGTDNLNNLLDEQEQRRLFCKREQLVTLVFSPAGESWTERLQWLLMTGGFCSPLSREEAAPALNFLAGYTGRGVVEQLAPVIVWNDAGEEDRP
ncbi:hypothetical protein GS039_004729 [Salmonella enterica]|nr:hypothetical protein [Salmonella enterica]EEJ5821992.1 hypothetical protein [Salmonella enterica]